MTRVVLADDQAAVRVGFRVLLEKHGGIVVMGEATGGREAVAVVVCKHPNAAYMDLWAPARDGLTTTWQIVASRQDRSPAVLMVTTFDLGADVFGALEAGADGSTLEDREPKELVDAVRRLATGCELMDHTVTRRMIAELARRHAPVGNIAGIRELTVRELEIMKLLAAGMSNAKIVTELVVEISTVKSHLTRILFKIGAGDRV